MERLIVTQFLYPAITYSNTSIFSDQYAFRPTRSPTAAIISTSYCHSPAYRQSVCHRNLIIFSKVFDTVRHSALLDKMMAQLDMPDEVYNWLVSFFNGHSHCTHYRGNVSTASEITASVIQGSSIGPASYVVNTGDLQAATPGNLMIKFADDTYIIIPAINANSRLLELGNVELWSRANNLNVNPAKYAEIIFVDKKRKVTVQPPLPMTNNARVTSMKVLGVTIGVNFYKAARLEPPTFQTPRLSGL